MVLVAAWLPYSTCVSPCPMMPLNAGLLVVTSGGVAWARTNHNRYSPPSTSRPFANGATAAPTTALARGNSGSHCEPQYGSCSRGCSNSPPSDAMYAGGDGATGVARVDAP